MGRGGPRISPRSACIDGWRARESAALSDRLSAISDRNSVLSLTVYDWDISSTLAAGTIVDNVEIADDRFQSGSHALGTYQYQW